MLVNAGNLAVGKGQSLALLGGVVLNTGRLAAPEGLLTVAAVPGQHLVRLNQPGSLLSFEVAPLSPSTASLSLTPPSLAQLLTGGNLSSASRVTVNPDGSIRLNGTNQDVPVRSGTTLVSGTLDASGATGERFMCWAITWGCWVRALERQAAGVGDDFGGGGYRGQGGVPNASSTYVDAGSVLTANGDSIRTEDRWWFGQRG